MKSGGLVGEGNGLSCFTRNGGQILFLSEAERNEEYRVCYFMFLSDDVAMLCSSSFAIIILRKRFFLSFTSGFDSGKQLAEGGRGRNRGKLKEICIIYF